MMTATEAPSVVAGISAAELETMQDAADAFRGRFTGGRKHEPVTLPDGSRHYRILASADLFAALEEPFSPRPPDSRTKCIVDINLNGSHYYH